MTVGALLTLAAAGQAEAPKGMDTLMERANLTGPLIEAIAKVAKAAGVEIQTDWEQLATVGIGRQTEVVLLVRQATAGQILSMILAQVSPDNKPLAWYVKDGQVCVTTQREAIAARRADASEAGPVAGRKPVSRPAPPAEIRFDHLPLSDVVTFFQEATGVNFQVGWNALEAVGITRDTPVSLELSGVTYGRALTAVTDLLSSGKDKYASVYWLVDDGVVRITTGSDLDKDLKVRILDVTDLLLVVPDFVSPRMNTDAAGVNAEKEQTAPLNLFDEPDATRTDTDSDAAARARVREELIEAIKATIGPEMWQPEGRGSIRFVRNQLVISQTDLGFLLMERAGRR